MSAQVLKPGPLSSLQDGGRPGYAALGIGRAGAADWPAWRLANALVGNRGDEAALEFTLAGPTLRFEQAATIALTGAPAAARADGRPLPAWTCCQLSAGSVLSIDGMARGCRGYLAVRGGFAAVPVLGSRSADLHAGLGGRALRAGDRLDIAPREPLPGRPDRHRSWSLDPGPWFDYPQARSRLALLRGSHADRLEQASREQLFRTSFAVSKDANRTAVRLDGPRLALSEPLELVSEACLPGTMQLPPSGQPIVLMAEAPATGGYPRIGQLAAVDLAGLAQRRPGDAVCFRETSLDECLQRLERRRLALERLLAAVAHRLEHP